MFHLFRLRMSPRRLDRLAADVRAASASRRRSQGRDGPRGGTYGRGKRRGVLTAGSAVLGLSLVATACGGGGNGSEGGVTTIRWASWDAAEQAVRPAIMELVKKFEQTHPKIKIELEPIPFSDIERKVLLQLQSGNAPDVVQTAPSYTVNFAEADALAPLAELAGEEYVNGLIPRVRELGKVNGELVAVPWAVAPFGFWYNKKLLEKAGLDPGNPPSTIDELLKAVETVKKEVPGAIPLGIDSTNRPFGLDAQWSWMRTFGVQPFQDGRATANTPAMRSYLKFMRTLSQENYTEPGQKSGYFRPIAANNKVAFMWDGPYFQGQIMETAKVDAKTFYETWGVTQLPAGPSGTSYTVPTDHQLGVMASSEHKEEAWTFVKWLSSSEAALEVVVEQKVMIPPQKQPPGKIAELSDTPVFNAFRQKVLPTVIRPPWGPSYGKVSSPIMSGVQQAMTSNKPLPAITTQMQSALEAELAR